MTGMRKSLLSPARRRLVELMQQVNFGRIEGLQVTGGQPRLEPGPRVVREIKLGGENGPRHERAMSDFVLQSELVQLFELLDQIRNGVILVLEVKHGKPFRFELEEKSGVLAQS